MSTEIERKFLLTGDGWRKGARGTLFRQGYLSTAVGHTVRVRLAGAQAWITIKGPTVGLARAEYEYRIPPADAAEMLDTLCEKPLIEKTRYEVGYAGMLWEIDEFHGDNDGLLVAEIELDSAEQQFDLPPWIGPDVSDQPKYRNSRLVKKPYNTWNKKNP